ncbi:hypothetical protein JCM10207_001529 [Rhodosporidiobolus poonsookiae]
MSTRIKHPRKATASTSYADPAVFDEIGGRSEEEDEEEQEDNKGTGKGKGRARKNRSEDDDEDDSPQPKKRKTTKGKGKAKKDSKPKEDLLRTMPMDLLVEIFSYLVPGELLNLSRTAKAYHDLLSSKKSRSIWRRSRRIVKLPDLEDENWSEAAYASLMFGTKCENCDRKYTGRPDFYLRVRLCKECRKDSFVKLHKLKKEHPQYHSRLDESRRAMRTYTLRSEADYWNKVLCEAQEQDDADAEIARLLGSSTGSSTTRSGRRSQALASKSDASKSEASNVNELVAERKEELEMLQTAGKALADAWAQTRELAKQDNRRFWSEQWRIQQALRPDLVKNKEQQTRATNTAKRQRNAATWGLPWTASNLINTAKPLTDDEWLRIKAEVLEIVDRNREERQKREADWQKQEAWRQIVDSRTAAIVEHYQQLRTSEPDRFTRTAFPLKADFLLFESVKALQLPNKAEDDFENKDCQLTDEVWDAALPLIKEELAEYRLNLVLHAIKLILAATTESPVPDDDEILSNLEQYDDAFLLKATSFVCCDLDGCAGSPYAQWMPHWCARTFAYIAPLQQVLEHQHTNHADAKYYDEKAKAAGPRLHFSLPLEVACAASALLELGGLDDDAGVAELYEMDERAWFTWENTRTNKKHHQDWQDLLSAVAIDATQAAKGKSPRPLDPPSIVYHARRQRKPNRRLRNLSDGNSDSE